MPVFKPESLNSHPKLNSQLKMPQGISNISVGKRGAAFPASSNFGFKPIPSPFTSQISADNQNNLGNM